MGVTLLARCWALRTTCFCINSTVRAADSALSFSLWIHEPRRSRRNWSRYCIYTYISHIVSVSPETFVFEGKYTFVL